MGVTWLPGFVLDRAIHFTFLLLCCLTHLLIASHYNLADQQKLPVKLTPMCPAIPEKLLKIVDLIDKTGNASLTRLTILKKWFEQGPKRLSSFSIFIANRALTSKGNEDEKSAKLFREAGALLRDADVFDPKISRKAADKLFCSLREFQNEYKHLQWGAVRIVFDLHLFLIEDGLRIYLQDADSPSDGYRLAVSYCENYDPKYGNGLNGPSTSKITEISNFIRYVETQEARSPIDSGILLPDAETI